MTLVRASLRHLVRHPWQSGLSVVGIALGVGVVVSIDLVNASARRAFTLSAEGVAGRATHQVLGGPAGLDERVFVRLVQEAGVEAAAPIVEGWVGVAGAPGRALRLLGVDPLREAPFRPYLGRGAVAGRAVSELVAEPGSVLLSRETADGLGVTVGGSVVLRVAGRSRTVRVVGVIDAGDAAGHQALAGLVVADIATAQEILEEPGRLSRVDLRVPEGLAGDALLARARGVLPAGAEVVTAGTRGAFLAEVTRAFHVNLAALSLLALVVGLFLVYNTMTFSVVQRRAVIGVLRALGVTRPEVFALVAIEGLALGAVATALGLGLGVWLARGLVGLVTRTINDLYFVVIVRDLAISPGLLAKGAALGLGATRAGALGPAVEATGGPPGAALGRARLEARVRRAVPRAALGGLALLATSGALLAFSERSLGWSYAAVFVGILGAALLTPLATAVTASAARVTLGRLLGLPGRMAARGVVRALSRTGIAVAALMVAVAATVGVDIMIGSFRATVVRWLETSLVADLYVSVPSPTGGRTELALDPALVARLSAVPGVAAVGTYRAVHVGAPHGPTQLIALGVAPRSREQFRFLAGEASAIWPAFLAGDAAIVSEPFAYRHGLEVGAAVRLRTDRGERDFAVVGVFADYGSDRGVVMVSRGTYERYWDDRRVSSLGIFAAPGTDPGDLLVRLRAHAGDAQELLIRPTRAIREASLEIFDRTFAITGVLRLLATAVAVVGVLSALLALQLERARELGVLRAQGLTPGELWRLVLAQTGLMGAIAGTLALPVGVALALALVHVINRRAFGWTIETTVPLDVLAQALALAVLAALAAGVYPAWRMARTPPAPALREE